MLPTQVNTTDVDPRAIVSLLLAVTPPANPGDCWNAPRLVWDGRRMSWSRRLSHEIFIGPISRVGEECPHYLSTECGNSDCVNPDHLVNVNWYRVHTTMRGGLMGPRGEESASSKLTANQVMAIRRRHAQGETQTSLSKEYGCSQTNISHIVKRKTWRHI